MSSLLTRTSSACSGDKKIEKPAREKLDEELWVSRLIALLPSDIAEIIIKEPEDRVNDFQHIKQVLFKRFKLSSRALSNIFENHGRKPNTL